MDGTTPLITDRRGQPREEEPQAQTFPQAPPAPEDGEMVTITLTASRDGFKSLRLDAAGLSPDQVSMLLHRASRHMDRQMFLRDFIGAMEIKAAAAREMAARGGRP